MGTDKRERQKQARQEKIEALRRAEQRDATKRRGLLIGLAVVAFLAFAIIFSVATSGDDDDDVATGDPDPVEDVDDTSTTASTIPPTTVAAVVEGTEECPAADGSSPRTIDFSDTFQNCLQEGVDYQARFVTTEGDVVIDLLEDEMPNTVNNFVALARYQYYDDTVLFRTNTGIDIIQGGSPHTQDNSDPGPGYRIPDTGGVFTTNELGQYVGPFSYEEGQLIMARSAGPDSSSAQFFFSTGPDVSLLDSQGTYLLFGEVVEGLDVLQAIIGLHEGTPDNPDEGAPSREVLIERVEILEL